MISAMVAQAAIETKRREGVAMAHSLYALLAGRMQFRFLRHAVADWALSLAPASARALFMKGEAILRTRTRTRTLTLTLTRTRTRTRTLTLTRRGDP